MVSCLHKSFHEGQDMFSEIRVLRACRQRHSVDPLVLDTLADDTGTVRAASGVHRHKVRTDGVSAGSGDCGEVVVEGEGGGVVLSRTPAAEYSDGGGGGGGGW